MPKIILVEVDRYGLPGTGSTCVWSPSGDLIGIAHASSPFYTFLRVVNDELVFIDDESPPQCNNGNAIDFAPNGVHIGVAHAVGFSSNQRAALLKRDGNSITTVDTTTDVPGTGQDVRWCPNSTYLAIAHLTSPFLTLMKRDGDTFLKVDDYNTGGSAYAVDFSPNDGGQFLVVGHFGGDGLALLERVGDSLSLVTTYSLPSTCSGVRFSSDGAYIAAVAGAELFVLERNGASLTEVAQFSLPGTGHNVRWGQNDATLFVANGEAPHVNVIEFDGVSLALRSSFDVGGTAYDVNPDASDEYVVTTFFGGERFALLKQIEAGSIYGKVEDDSGNPLQFAVVTAEGDFTFTTETDENGEYWLDVAPGTYDVTIDRKHYDVVVHTDVVVLVEDEIEINVVTQVKTPDYEVWTAEDLLEIETKDPTAYYVQMADIDLSGYDVNSGYPYHGEPSPPPELIWVNSDMQALPIEWIRVDSVAEVRDDAEIIRARYRVVTLNLAEGGFFDELGFFRNLLHDKITGNNVVYFPIAPLAQGVPLEIPVFGAVAEAQIMAVHFLPKEPIVGHDEDYAQLQLVNKDSGEVMSTLTFIQGIDAPAYEVISFGPVNQHGEVEIFKGVSFRVEQLGGGLALPESVLIIEWNLR